ncbi:F-box protein [Melia azedarach]|uniref:F-box protein n=1 Tax=Melia azedarach TaxID=155640 RepID=A0ACC1XRV0_MELAZ|nr:F-box protein [Melia azedarach]
MMVENGDSLGDMLIEILAKLPVKSLLRLRWVSKSWYNLVKDPIFISKHLKSDNNTRLIIIYAKEVEKGSDTEEEMADGSKPVEPRDFLALYPDETLEDLSLQDLDPHIPVTGSIWGPYSGIMIIIGITNLVSLWNLATQESTTLPKLGILSQYSLHTTKVGFGLDLMTNDYKLVLIMKLLDEKKMLLFEFHHVAVYTLGTNSWRVLECSKSFLDDIAWFHDSIYWEGAFYWLLNFKHKYDSHNGILSFNLGDEEFQEIQGPRTPKSAEVSLDVFNDSLTVLFLDANSHWFEAWALKNGNWIKQFTVGPFIGFYKPLRFWKKGSFFVELNTRQLLLYEPSTGEMRDFGLECIWFSTHMYKESLITIKRGDNLLLE